MSAPKKKKINKKVFCCFSISPALLVKVDEFVKTRVKVGTDTSRSETICYMITAYLGQE